MSRGVNKFIGIGYLGKDPETRKLPAGTAVTNFSIAINENWKDKQTGEEKERTEWINCEAWGKLGEICAEYLKKGSQVYVDGKLQTDKWTDKEGVDRWTTKIRMDNVQFLSTKDGNARPQPAPPDAVAGDSKKTAASPQADFDDDIPF